jgi:hypothetical protein
LFELQIYKGMSAVYPLQCVARITGDPLGTLLASDVPTAEVWAGQDQHVVFSPNAAWKDGIGWQSGQVQVTIGPAESALLEPNGTYLLIVTVSRGADTYPVWEGRLVCEPVPGSTINQIKTYCTYADMLARGGWVAGQQALSIDQEGFYNQRLLARNWMDWIITQNWDGGQVSTMGDLSQSAFWFGGGGYRSIGPDPYIINALAADQLIIRPRVVEACAHYALAEVGLAQLGSNDRIFSIGQYHQVKAERALSGITAEIDTNADGQAEMFINLIKTQTLQS